MVAGGIVKINGGWGEYSEVNRGGGNSEVNMGGRDTQKSVGVGGILRSL